MLIKINSQNTASGNPRRGWLQVSDSGRFLAFFDEGYDDGGLELRELRKTEPEAFPAINVTPKEFKRISKLEN